MAKNENSLLNLSNELQLAEKKVRLEALKMEDEFEKQKAQLSSEFKTRLEAVSVRVEAMQTERSQLLAEEEALKGDIGLLLALHTMPLQSNNALNRYLKCISRSADEQV